MMRSRQAIGLLVVGMVLSGIVTYLIASYALQVRWDNKANRLAVTAAARNFAERSEPRVQVMTSSINGQPISVGLEFPVEDIEQLIIEYAHVLNVSIPENYDRISMHDGYDTFELVFREITP